MADGVNLTDRQLMDMLYAKFPALWDTFDTLKEYETWIEFTHKVEKLEKEGLLGDTLILLVVREIDNQLGHENGKTNSENIIEALHRLENEIAELGLGFGGLEDILLAGGRLQRGV